MKFQESEYFEYIGKSFKSSKNKQLAHSKKRQLSVEEKLKLVLNQKSFASSMWKNNTELLYDIGERLAHDEASFMLDTNRIGSREQDDFWDAKDETLDFVIWPERYNKIHNYYLLSKNKREREQMKLYEGVGRRHNRSN